MIAVAFVSAQNFMFQIRHLLTIMSKTKLSWFLDATMFPYFFFFAKENKLILICDAEHLLTRHPPRMPVFSPSLSSLSL